jgi:hypothetical protein
VTGDFKAIRTAIASALAVLKDPGVSINGSYQPMFVSPYILDDPQPPVLMVEGIDAIDYSAGDQLHVNLICHVGETTQQGAQALLDELLMGDRTVQSLLTTDRTLGGTVDDLYVAAASGHRPIQIGQKKVMGGLWVVHIVLPN